MVEVVTAMTTTIKVTDVVTIDNDGGVIDDSDGGDDNNYDGRCDSGHGRDNDNRDNDDGLIDIF